MNREQAAERVKLEREMDDDFNTIRAHIQYAYHEDDEGWPPCLSKAAKESLFQAFLSLSRRLKALEERDTIKNRKIGK